MALQEVVKATIFQFNEAYVNHFLHKLTDKSLSCKSCGVEFERLNFIYSELNPRGPWTKRHLVCAIAHNVISIREAKELARGKELDIDWPHVEIQVRAYLEKRRAIFARLACLALSVVMFGAQAINAIL